MYKMYIFIMNIITNKSAKLNNSENKNNILI